MQNSGCYIENKKKNFKNLLVKNYLPDFKTIWHKWSFGKTTKVVKIILIRLKICLPGGGISFSYTIIGKTFKNPLVKNYWYDDIMMI